MKPKSFVISFRKAILFQIVDSDSLVAVGTVTLFTCETVVSIHRENTETERVLHGRVLDSVQAKTIPAVAAARVDFSIRAGCALCIPVDATPRTDVTAILHFFSRGLVLASSRLGSARFDSAPSVLHRRAAVVCVRLGYARTWAKRVLHLQLAFRVRSLLNVAEYR